MAEKYKETAAITPEEAAEIERILGVLPGGASSRKKTDETPASSQDLDESSDFQDVSDTAGEIQDITSMVEIEDEPEPSFDFQDQDEFASSDAFPEAGSDTFSGIDDSAFGSDETVSDALPDIDFGGETDSAEPSFGFDETPSSVEAPSGAGKFQSLKDKIASKFKKKIDTSTAEGQIESLLEDEPDAVDDQDISKDIFVGGEDASADSSSDFSLDDQFSQEESSSDEMPSFEDSASFDDLGGVSLDGSADFSGPDLSDIDIGGKADVPTADIDELPEIDFSSSFDEPGASSGDISFGSDEVSAGNSFSGMDSGIDNIEAIDDVVRNQAPEMNSRGYIPAPETDEDALDLTVHEMRKLKNALKLMSFGLMKAVKDAIVNDKLSKDDTSELVNMILDGAREDDVQAYLEEKLGIVIDTSSDSLQRRRIYAREEYTQEGRERQKILLKRTRNMSIAGLLVIVLGVLGYQYVYKPFMAKRLINKGVELIRKNNDPKTEDYAKAEELFREVDAKYKKDYLYGYNSYGRAYFDKKEYDRSIDKLNRGYKIAEKDNFIEYDILNNLGYFYSKVPARYFNELKPHLKRYYYEITKPIDKVDTQLDVALDFYRKANNKNPDDITSLYGIGNAYFYQGQFLKARKYFEDIIAKAPDSPIGYSGLMNLFIERDAFAETIDLYVKMRDKDLLPEVPSPLLAKAAWYVMSKKADEKNNVRIDFGIQSPRLKDSEDNPFPVVADILKALKKRDANYPPLYLQYAKLAILQRNPKLAENYLFTALDHAESKNEKYFGALALLGEFYYMTKDPVKSYKYLRAAESAYQTQPEFTYEEFYKETESIGKTYALEGNLFYYFFDKIKLEQADLDSLESEDVDRLEDKMENYSIAQNKYQKALDNQYESSELHYNLGRIYYMNRLYEDALSQWMNLYDDFARSPELMFSLGNVFLRLNNLDSAKAQYTKVISVFELDADRIKKVDNRATSHIKVYETLAASYNNLGAVYQLQNNEAKSSLAYWKSIEYAQKLGTESEYSRVNLGRSFKQRTEEVQPLINDNIPYSLEIYREDMRI